MNRRFCKMFTIIVLILIFTSFVEAIGDDAGEDAIKNSKNGINDLNITPFESFKNPKMDSVISELAHMQKTTSSSDLSTFATLRDIQVSDDKIKVILVVNDETEPFSEYPGVEVEGRYKNLVEVLLPVSQIENIAEDPSVQYIRRPLELHHNVVSQGVEKINATTLHGLGINGTGVKVAVIDLGFSGYDSSSEIWNVVEAVPFTGDITGGGQVHGSACAEVILDVAPNASLYLYRIANEVDFGQAVDRSISQGVDIISCSLAVVNAGPYDGTGVICDIANNASANDILFTCSAGNYARKHYEGDYNDTDANSTHEFSIGSLDEVLDLGTISLGDTISLYLSWDDWVLVDQDYDLYLLEYNGGWNVVDFSLNLQNGGGGQYPTESITYTSTGGYYGVAILNYSATRPAHLELFSFNNDFLEYNMESSSIMCPADAATVLTVGATYWSNDNLETFSSQGPTNDGRTKPDVTAPDGNTNSFTDPIPFYGTSSSAPHTAGAAALLLDTRPSLSNTELQYYLESTAKDLDVAGKDNRTGSGRIDVYAAYQALTSPSPVHNLNTSENFTTIQAAIYNSNTSSGNIITVDPGTYNENIVVNKSLTIRSTSGNSANTVVNAYNSNEHVFNVTVDDVNISGLKVTGASGASKGGIYLGSRVDRSNISNNNVSGNTAGIYLYYSGSYNTIENNTATSNNYGINLFESENNTITNNTCTGNSPTGIYLYDSINNTLTENNCTQNTFYGINLDGILEGSNNNTLINNTANSNTFTGIYIDDSNNNTIVNNTANSNNNHGISLESSRNNTLKNNTMSTNMYNFKVHDDSLSGYINNIDTSNKVEGKPIYFWLNQQDQKIPSDAGYVGVVNSSNITVENLTLEYNNQGVLFAYTNNSTIQEVNASNNCYGIDLYFSKNNSVISNNASNNGYGIFLEDSTINTLTENTASNNTYDDFYSDQSSQDNSIINLTVGSHGSYPTKSSITYGNGIKIKGVDSPPLDPSGMKNIGTYINATNETSSSYVFLNISYNESDISSINESTLRMWRYNGTTWTEVAGSNVNEADNYVYANITNFSIFAPLANAPPNVTSYAPTSPVNDVENVTRKFNISIDQAANVSWKINGTEVQTNTSVTNASYTNTSAPLGIWNVSACLNNANGSSMKGWLWNVTEDTEAPVISSVTPSNASYINDSTPEVRVNYSDASGVNTSLVRIFVNSENVTSNATISSTYVQYNQTSALNDGLQNATINLTDKSKYQNNVSLTWNFTVDTIDPTLTASSSQGTSTYETQTTISGTVNGTGSTPELKINGGNVSITMAGTYNGTYSKSYSLSEGENTFNIVVTDGANNTNSESLKVTRNVQTQTQILGGGGGGGGGSMPSSEIETDSYGNVLSTYTKETSDGKAKIIISEGNVALDADGKPLESVSISPVTLGGTLAAFNLGPDGATFDPPIELKMKYDPKDAKDKDLVIKIFRDKKWTPLETTLDPSTNTATAKIDHFTIFALFAENKATTTAPIITQTTPPEATSTPTPTTEPSNIENRGLLIGIIGVIITLVVLIILGLIYNRNR